MNLFLVILSFLGCLATAIAFGWLLIETVPDAKRAKARLEHTRRRKWNEEADARDLRHEIILIVFCVCEIALHLWLCYRIIKTGVI